MKRKERQTLMADAARLRRLCGLLEQMRCGTVGFAYRKESTGRLRRAHGTLSRALVPPVSRTAWPRPADSIVYWDTDKRAWRSFKTYNFVAVLPACAGKARGRGQALPRP